MRQWKPVTWMLYAAICLLGTGRALAQDKQGEKIDLPDWKTLRAAYDYDSKQSLDAKAAEKKGQNAYALHITFHGAKGNTVPGIFERPNKEGVYPIVLLLHGLGRDKEEMIKIFGAPLLEKGFAVLALDAPHHGERKVQGENQQAPDTFAEALREGCLDYRRSLDWLAARKDVDMKHVGLLGYSMGAFMGAILGGVEDRIGAFALCVGGDPIIAFIPQVPEALRAQIFTICPSLYIEHIAPRPVLMLNGKQDKTVAEAASKRLYAAAKDPKEQVWYDSGHILPPPALDKCVVWLGEKLKNDNQTAPRGNKADTKTDKE